MIEIPSHIQIFVLVGVALVVLIVPIRILYEMTKDTRERTRRLQELAERLKERLGAVRFSRGIFGPHRIHFTYEGRPATLFQAADKELSIHLEPKVEPKFHAIVRTRGPIVLPFAVMWESLRLLRRIRTFDPLIDESMAIYATPVFGNYLRDLALDGIPAQGKPTGLAESLVVLRRAPGVRRFEFRMSPVGGFRISFELRADDLMYRPDELESAVHHAFRLYDLLVLF
jgi:hypothetical protein